MKRIFQIGFLTGMVMLFFFGTGYCQQRPSQRSFNSIMNEVNQQRAARNKMLQQMKLTIPSNIVVPTARTQNQPAPGSTVAPTAIQKSLSSPGANQQPVNNQISPQPKAPPAKKL